MRDFEIRVVLVRPIYESNVGATARSMSNMGADKLILINPACELGLKAHQSAASGQKPLENHVQYKNWDEFYQNESEGIRISFTARDGRGRQVQDFATTLNWIRDEHPLMRKESGDAIPIYLIFGPEDWGLSTEDLELTHYACSIPTFGDNTSLNLAQAALLALYTLRTTWGGQRARLMGQQSPKKNSARDVFPEETLHLWLTEMGFDIDDNKKINSYTVLKRLLLQNIPTKKELGILEIVLQQSIRKLKAYNILRKKYQDNGE